MVNIQYSNAMAEVLHYLKGIRKEDIEKISKNFLKFIEENSSKEYVCKFDYNKPLKELELLNETRGIIGTICLNYWCQNEEQRQNYLNKLSENERKYQEEIQEKYNLDNLFKNRVKDKSKNLEENETQKVNIIEYKESVFIKIKNWFKNLFYKNKIKK